VNSQRSPIVKEKRSCTRVQLKLSTSLLLVRIDVYHSGMIDNLSLGGCYFPVEHALPIGEKCQVDIAFGDGLDVEKISVSGQVARVDNHGAGIEFVDNSPEIMTSLEQILLRYSLQE
jgi:hypothetical protein